MLLLARTASAQAAVELTHFEVQDREDGVLVTWGTGNELTTYGFNLYRGTVNDPDEARRLNEAMIKAKRFPDVVGADYQYLDTGVETGTTYYYWLEAFDLDGNQMHGPKWTTHGPSATATPTATSTPTRKPTLTPTTRPSPTATPTQTQAPTPTPTVVPSVSPTFTATSLPIVSPTGTPTTTEAAHPSSSVAPSVTPLPTSTATVVLAVASATASRPTAANSPSPMDEGSGLHGAAESGANGVSWPFVSMSALLLLASVTSLLGALLALVAYLLIRRFGV
jgi:hypothetical protein